jgi:uncharacterized protein
MGKTSWLKTHLPNSLYFDLLFYGTYKKLANQPPNLEKPIPRTYTDWIIIDEVQRIPELLNEVHRLIELRKFKFILTGSSARSLRRRGVNLLAGCAVNYFMHPLVMQELGLDFNLPHALQYGLLPVAVTTPHPENYLAAYIDNYVREEVLQESLIRNSGSFSSFLEAASLSQGQLVNYSEIARELLLNRATVGHYFTILEDLLIGVPIQPFKKRAKRKLISHQKFYFFDEGIYRYLRQQGPEEIDGPGLETLFLQSARALNDYFKLKYSIYFWRTQTDLKVDFVLYGPGGIHAFEIKRSSQVTSKSLTGLKAFGEEYPEAKLYLLYLGDHTEYHSTITALPFEEALKRLPELLGYTPPLDL